MADIPGDSSTTATISVGSTINDSIEVAGDHDWFRLNLTAGQSISVALNGTGANPLSDPYLRIRDASGNILFENDDGGPGLNSLVAFQATYTGVYYVDVAAWEDSTGSQRLTGTYSLSVANYVPPPTATADQIADQLVSGYWNGDVHHFNVSQGGNITVNLSALTVSGQATARQALATWSSIIGVNFVEVSTGGQITFDDSADGANTSGSWSGGMITSEHVNISTQWLTDYGTAVGTYGYQSYLHEIGHALGLGHAGDYNTTADYPYDAKFANDSWAMSVMSYFSQTEAQTGYSRAYIATPMVSDLLAVSRLYGLSTTTRSGDTTYGFGSTANNPAYDASSYPNVAYTIFDAGGVDTLNYSGFSSNQKIDLNQGAFSNIGGKIGNVAIAYGTIIENAIGGSGSDTIIGNTSNNVLTGGGGADSLTGGGGADIFRDTAAGLNGDTITDFSAIDQIVITDASLSGFTISLSGTRLTYTGGSLTLLNAPGNLSFKAAAGGGVTIYWAGVTNAHVANDFNGDGLSDLLWRNDNGTVTDWLANGSGAFASNDSALFTSVPASWHVAGTGDFNGDGRADILWRNDNGNVTDWLSNSAGGFASNDGAAFTPVPTSWHIVATGDFNGDGRADVLWRNDNGTVTDWLANASGGFASNDGAASTPVPTSWQVVGTGDFNGDGRTDVLWRNTNGAVTDWLGTASGGFTGNDGAAFTPVPNSWHVLATGDFNGDGRADVLWRNDNGTVTDWLGTANGGFQSNDASIYRFVSADWQVQDTGDYNGDGRTDILWRNSNGTVTNWLGTPTGGFADNDSHLFTSVPASWHIQAPDTNLI